MTETTSRGGPDGMRRDVGGRCCVPDSPPREDAGGLRVAVVDGCSYGRLGIVSAVQALSGPGPEGVLACDTLTTLVRRVRDAVTKRGVNPSHGVWGWDALVVRLPSAPQTALDLLLTLGAEAVRRLPVRRLVLLSPFPAVVVLDVLAGTGCAWPVQVVAADLPVVAVRSVVRPVPLRGRRRARPGVTSMDVPGGICTAPMVPRLSERERLVLWHSVRAVSVYTQARHRARSHKTLYGQRTAALHKLGVGSVSELLRGFVPIRHGLVDRAGDTPNIA